MRKLLAVLLIACLPVAAFPESMALVGFGGVPNVSGAPNYGTDNFVRTNEDPLSQGGNWTAITGMGNLKIVDNVLKPASEGSYSGALRTGTFSATQEAIITITGGSVYHAAVVRGSNGGSGLNGYIAQLSGSAGTINMVRWNNGSQTELEPSVQFLAFTSGNRYKISAADNVITVSEDTGSGWTVKQTYTDATHSTGAPGVVVYTSTPSHISLWAGGDQ